MERAGASVQKCGEPARNAIRKSREDPHERPQIPHEEIPEEHVKQQLLVVPLGPVCGFAKFGNRGGSPRPSADSAEASARSGPHRTNTSPPRRSPDTTARAFSDPREPRADRWSATVSCRGASSSCRDPSSYRDKDGGCRGDARPRPHTRCSRRSADGSIVLTVAHSGNPGIAAGHVLPVLSVIGRHVDEAVVASGPNQAFLHRRFRDRKHRAVGLHASVVAGDRPTRPLLFRFVVSGQIRTDRFPGLATVARAEDDLRAMVNRLRIVG